MHEMSYIYPLIEVVREELKKTPVKKVCQIELEVGEYLGLVDEVLQVAFEAAKSEVPEMQDTELKIIKRETRVSCEQCGHEQVLEVPWFLCSECGQQKCKFLSGKELNILSMEVEE
jgi:hydrogenase nickel incorporation protein HypA/HybF